MASLNQALGAERTQSNVGSLSSLGRSDSLDHIQQSGQLQQHSPFQAQLVEVARILSECLATSPIGLFV